MNSHQADEMAHRDRDSAERHNREQYPAQAGTPHHSNAGSLTIHQPVATRLPGAIHSPGSILANHGSAPPMPIGSTNSFGGGQGPPETNRAVPHSAQSASSQMFGVIGGQNTGPTPSSSGPASVFGGPLQQEGNRPSGQALPFGGAAMSGAHPMPGGSGALPQGQQPILNVSWSFFLKGNLCWYRCVVVSRTCPVPISTQASDVALLQYLLNLPIHVAFIIFILQRFPLATFQIHTPVILQDALSYLDQVKVQFADQPDVYNRFLDIMKDFKSQTIDTPGVINRVSELFAGHPNLIQGFNTFLPPGYRIECGTGNDPNTIRVTTPMGTTVQSITGRVNQGADGSHGQFGSNAPFFNHRQSNWQQQQQSQPQHSIESPEATFSAPVTNGSGIFNQTQASGQTAPFDGPTSAQPPRGTSQVQNNTTPIAPVARTALTPTPGATGAANSGAAQTANIEKRGPVEFNHAISYVNKIKNRFQDKPEIYKQFLEILQTYQREQKPIQDVYAQVTSLFNTAPDLLEDFKQFLPESAASAKSNQARSEEMLAVGGLAQTTPQPGHTIRDGQKLPPVGSFAPPPSATKDNKKRPRNDKQSSVAPPSMAESLLSGGQRTVSGAQPGPNKRPKLNHKPLGPDAPTIEPTLTPTHPEPLPPTSSASATAEELGFFEKVKKYISNRTSMIEFLKLCNMYSQSLIDTNDLVHKADRFIGSNPELMNWFKNFMGYEGEGDVMENRPKPPAEKVSLSNCRGSGPSYRLLPRREKLKPCGGRDEMCNSVLNDEWASHPTWASEDSGFVAHRKNAFEEGLHRIEEERHDYDFNIEANVKCIQLLEPIAQQMLNMTAQERETFVMPPGLGGPSTSIYRRVLKKIYGPERGSDVVNDMFQDPFAVVPVVLARLKQKDEEWRFTQREWEKVWQAQTEIMHLKSLDHMGIQVKQNDKRNLSQKHLVDVIKTKHEEQRRIRSTNQKVPRYQFAYELGDREVILDLLRFMVMYGMNNGHHSASEKERIVEFFESFIPQFFDLPEDKVQDRLHDIDCESGEEDAEEQLPAELTNGRSRRNGKKSDLLRGVLDPGRNGTKSRKEKEDSAASGSKETTPDVGSANEEEMGDAAEEAIPSEFSNERWLPIVPRATVVKGTHPLLDSDGELKADGFFPRPWYNFFCNQTIYVFFSILQTLYKRLKDVKDSQQSVLDEITRAKSKKPAKDLGITVNEINYFDENDPSSFWPKTVELIEDYITGEIDENRYQEVLRHYYLKKGWTLYTIQDLMKTLCRLSLICTSTDSKEKTPDLIAQFLNNRLQEETSYQTEISARTFAQKCIKDADMFVICWFPQKNEATVRWLQRDETTFYMDEMEVRERWQYYISSYMRVEPTEGVPRARLRKTVLARNLPSSDVDLDDGTAPKPLKYEENLPLAICLNSNEIVWDTGASEYFIYSTAPEPDEEKAKAEERAANIRDHREQLFREKLVMNSPWMRNVTQHEVQQANERFQAWFKDGVAPDVDMEE
ncbi:paired amphipathic helix protein Sin3b [Pseudomassariella vexata]|uniref:Paired amphipathic helix protein Sin3b n=1 Tax=Pseudomassariella vexata TaxID=1141098 RepID=A0A1Y2DDJ2_9PEZI|nr:paired amphipathic helix protein Sin3b [Pseudomassariella vexata]ORY57174.1 paired amphipathic helix protein Sin3b [Pseudomassariella vexata]